MAPTKRALLIGCTYLPDKKLSPLPGCDVDIVNMYNLLTTRFGFDQEDVAIFVDNDSEYPPPTGAMIMDAMEHLVSEAKSGDFIFIHYSGHGGQTEAEPWQDDEDGLDQFICPTDGNYIFDDDFCSFVKRLPPKCNVVIVSDACCSGGLVEGTKVQVGPRHEDVLEKVMEGAHKLRSGWTVKEGETIPEGPYMPENESDPLENGEDDGARSLASRGLVPRYVSAEDAVRAVTGTRAGGKKKGGSIQIRDAKAGNLTDPGSLRWILLNDFGEEAAPSVKEFARVVSQHQDLYREAEREAKGVEREQMILAFLQHLNEMGLGDVVHEYETVEDEQNVEVEDEGQQEPTATERLANALRASYAATKPKTKGGWAASLRENVVLITGCQPLQYSLGGPNGGVLTHCLLEVLEETDMTVSYYDLVLAIREKLAEQGDNQLPCLYCPPHMKKKNFLAA